MAVPTGGASGPGMSHSTPPHAPNPTHPHKLNPTSTAPLPGGPREATQTLLGCHPLLKAE